MLGRAQVAAEQYDTAASDNAQLRTERETQFAMNEHETAELADIERALEHMTQGDYGHCIDCAINIPMARLLASSRAHFDFEEDLMQRQGYPGFEMHREQHEELLAAMRRLYDELVSGRYATNRPACFLARA
mgnify:CR=1 FL=1